MSGVRKDRLRNIFVTVSTSVLPACVIIVSVHEQYTGIQLALWQCCMFVGSEVLELAIPYTLSSAGDKNIC